MTIPYDMAAIRGLRDYLITEVPLLNDVLDEFPYHGDELVLPTASVITAGTPTYLNLNSYIYSREQDPSVIENDIIKEVIAQLDGKIQIDLWSEYKIKRGELLELVTKAINKQNIEENLPNGLSLTLSDYHNVIARFDQVGYNYVDSELNSQKSEWRVKIDILFSHVVIESKSVARIEDITVINQISDNENVTDDILDIEEDFEIN